LAEAVKTTQNCRITSWFPQIGESADREAQSPRSSPIPTTISQPASWSFNAGVRYFFILHVWIILLMAVTRIPLLSASFYRLRADRVGGTVYPIIVHIENKRRGGFQFNTAQRVLPMQRNRRRRQETPVVAPVRLPAYRRDDAAVVTVIATRPHSRAGFGVARAVTESDHEAFSTKLYHPPRAIPTAGYVGRTVSGGRATRLYRTKSARGRAQ